MHKKKIETMKILEIIIGIILSFSIVVTISIFPIEFSYASFETFGMKIVNGDKKHDWHLDKTNMGGWVIQGGLYDGYWVSCSGDTQDATLKKIQYEVHTIFPGQDGSAARKGATGNGGYYPLHEQGVVTALLNEFSHEAKTNWKENSALGRAEDYLRLGENASCNREGTSCFRTYPELEDRAKEMLSHARKYAGPYKPSMKIIKMNEDKIRLDQIGLVSSTGNFMSNYRGRIIVNGSAVFSDTKTKTRDITSGAQAQYVDLDVVGNGEVKVNIEYDEVVNSYTIFTSQTHQNLITKGIPDKVNMELTIAVSVEFQPQVISSVPKRVLSAGDTLSDVLTILPAGNDNWIKDESNSFIPLNVDIDVYGPFDRPLPASDVVPKNVFPLSSRKIIAQPKTESEAKSGVVVNVNMGIKAEKSGYYTFVARIDKYSQGDFTKNIKKSFVSKFFDPTEVSVLPFEPKITSKASLDDKGNVVDKLFVSGFPADHGEFKGFGVYSPDSDFIQTQAYCVPDNHDNIQPVGKPLFSYKTPAKNGEYIIGGDKLLDEIECYDTVVFVSKYNSDDRTIPINTPANDKAEQIPSRPLIIKGSLLVDGLDADKHLSFIDGKAQLVDKVSVEWVKPGSTYTFVGELKDSATGEVLSSTSVEVLGQRPEKGKKTMAIGKMVYNLKENEKSLPSRVVSTVKIFLDGKLLAQENDLKNLEQSVWIPKISTSLTDSLDGDKFFDPHSGKVLVDKLDYEGFMPGKSYDVELVLVDSDTGEVIEQSRTNASFEPQFSKGNVSFEYIDVDLSHKIGSSLVSFITVKQGNITVLEHTDINNEKQTVYLPKLITKAFDKKDNDNVLKAAKSQTVIDELYYSGFDDSKEYNGKAWLVDKHTQKPFGKGIDFSFKPEKAPNNSFKIKYENMDFTGMEGESFVSLIEIKDKETNNILVEHTDIKNTDQTLHIPKIITEARDKVDGDKKLSSDKKQIIIDRQNYYNLEAGKEYEVHTWQVLKNTHQKINEAKITFFKPSEENSVLEVESNPIDMTNFTDEEIVTFVKVLDKKTRKVILEHKDIENKKQTVYTKSGFLPNLGMDIPHILLVTALIIATGIHMKMIIPKK